jgi:hypothetical protein
VDVNDVSENGVRIEGFNLRSRVWADGHDTTPSRVTGGIFSFRHCAQTGSGAQQASYPVSTGGP